MAALPAVVVFAREPVAGTAKTRLVPALGPEGAADLYKAFLQDRAAQVLAVEGILPVIAHTPDAAAPALATLLPPGLRYLPQGEGDLTARLTGAAATLFDEGVSAVVFMDSDSPGLPPDRVPAAVHHLASGAADCVLGPAEDGGYYLIGLAARAAVPAPALFEGIPWSTPEVLALTLERAAAAGLSTHLLDPWWDVDTPAELARLRAEPPDPDRAPRTTAWLHEHP